MSRRSPMSESAPGMTVDTGAAGVAVSAALTISSGDPALYTHKQKCQGRKDFMIQNSHCSLKLKNVRVA